MSVFHPASTGGRSSSKTYILDAVTTRSIMHFLIIDPNSLYGSFICSKACQACSLAILLTTAWCRQWTFSESGNVNCLAFRSFHHFSLGGGFKYFLCSPLFGEDEPILTSIFLKWVGSNHQHLSVFVRVFCYVLQKGMLDHCALSEHDPFLHHLEDPGGWLSKHLAPTKTCIFQLGCWMDDGYPPWN